MSLERYYSRCGIQIPHIDDALRKEHVEFRKDVENEEESSGVTVDLCPRKIGLGQVGEVRDLKHLTEQLHRVFESDHVNVEYVHKLMSAYKSNPADWKKFAKFDRYRYTRNLVDAGNDKFNLMILCWGEGHGSAIHDHADAHCFMKMLQGQLTETRFQWPEEHSGSKDGSEGGESRSMVELSRSSLEHNAVCYINDSLGLHRVENQSHTDVAISLHLYSPPFDACSVFNQLTGQRSKAKVTFWSLYGKRKNENYGEDERIPEDN